MHTVTHDERIQLTNQLTNQTDTVCEGSDFLCTGYIHDILLSGCFIVCIGAFRTNITSV
jgi:hypothetical protein